MRTKIELISVIDFCFRWAFWVIPALMDGIIDGDGGYDEYGEMMLFFSIIGAIVMIIATILFFYYFPCWKAIFIGCPIYIIVGAFLHFLTKHEYGKSFLF